eukprot:7698644-Pyramimonas_sp.AAC.1
MSAERRELYSAVYAMHQATQCKLCDESYAAPHMRPRSVRGAHEAPHGQAPGDTSTHTHTLED